MDKKRIYQGRISSGRGLATGIMSASGFLEQYKQLSGLSVIPGTVNISLTESFDLTKLNYFRSADYMGLQLDLTKLGIKYEGEQGFYHTLILVAGQYPAGIILFNWNKNPSTDAEIVSAYHLRSTLNLQEGDTIEFTLVED